MNYLFRKMTFVRYIFLLLPLAVVAQDKSSQYPDVSKMDIKARLDYYKKRERMEDSVKHKIPVVANNAAVSGENLPIAWATGVELMDHKRELKNPFMYSVKQRDKKAEDWQERYKTMYAAGKNPVDVDPFFITKGYNPFEENINLTAVGWFNPQSNNLFDEEIKEVYDTDGIIRLTTDETRLGAYMFEYYKWYKEQTAAEFKELHDNSVSFADMKFNDYYEVEPLLRNIFYVVKNSGTTGTTAWNHISISKELENIADPLDVYTQPGQLSQLQEVLKQALPYYIAIHKMEAQYTYGLKPAQIVNKLFYDNEKAFASKYEGKKVPVTKNN